MDRGCKAHRVEVYSADLIDESLERYRGIRTSVLHASSLQMSERRHCPAQEPCASVASERSN